MCANYIKTKATYCLLHLYLVDLDSKQFVCELIVKIKLIAIQDFAAFRCFCYDAGAPTSQGLKCSTQLSILDEGGGQYLLVAQNWLIVKQ